MPEKYAYKPARSSCLTIVALIALISFVINITIVYLLLFSIQVASTQLELAAQDMAVFAETSIEYTVPIDEVVAVNTEVNLNREIAVPLDLEIPLSEVAGGDAAANPDQTVTLNTTIPLDTVLTVPVEVSLASLFSQVNFEQEVTIPLSTEDVVSISSQLPNETIQVPFELQIVENFTVNSNVLGQIITIPVPLDISETFLATADLPQSNAVNIPINVSLGDLAATPDGTSLVVPFPSFADMIAALPEDEQTIVLNLPITVQESIAVEVDVPAAALSGLPVADGAAILPINTEVMIPLNQAIPIVVDVPIQADRPVELTLGDTELGSYLRAVSTELGQTADQMRLPFEIPPIGLPATLIEDTQNSIQEMTNGAASE